MIKDILKTSKQLLYDQPFYGSVLLSLLKEVTTKIPTACVGVNGIMFKLMVNPDFWGTLNEKTKKGLLIHELGHIINFHLTEYSHLEDKEIANIAMDIYINQTIPADMLPDGACTWDKYENLSPNQSTNWYYEKLVDNKENESDEALKNALSAMNDGDEECDDGKGGTMQVPKHDWDEVEESSDAVKKMLGKNTEVMLNDIIKNISDPGSVPAGLKDLLDTLSVIEPPKFNWRAFMKRFVGTSTRVDVRKTRRKKSKRFKDMAGSKEQYFSRILIGIDTSLSVNEAELKEFQGELFHMHRTGHDIEIMLCDTEIHDHFKYNPREPLKITGRGGTRFEPVVSFYEKNLRKYSCLIYLTDGESWDVKKARGNVLWVHSSISDINESLPGRKIKLN